MACFREPSLRAMAMWNLIADAALVAVVVVMMRVHVG
jgi:hypothetical protein